MPQSKAPTASAKKHADLAEELLATLHAMDEKQRELAGHFTAQWATVHAQLALYYQRLHPGADSKESTT